MMERTALVVVDSQEGIFGRGEHAAWRAEDTLFNIRLLIGKARAAKMPVVYIQHDDEGLPHGSAGWQVCREIEPEAQDSIIEKHTIDSFYKTELDAELRHLGIKTLIICGMQTEYCVDTICRRAFTMGYNAYLVADGHTTHDNGILTAAQIIAHHNHALQSEALQVKPTREMVDLIGR